MKTDKELITVTLVIIISILVMGWILLYPSYKLSHAQPILIMQDLSGNATIISPEHIKQMKEKGFFTKATGKQRVYLTKDRNNNYVLVNDKGKVIKQVGVK